MLLDLGRNGELQMMNPQRPNSNADQFIAHMLRSEAAAVPGIKGSTLTMDYRNSSFSSERSADNDTWPEIEGVQDWFYSNLCQPIYSRLVKAGIESGWFEGVVTAQEFAANQANFLAACWQGPVARSINPVQDAVAAKERISGGLSSPQRECRKLGVNCWDVLKEFAEFQQKAKELGVSEDLANQILGIEQRDLGPDDATATTDKPKPKQKPAKTDKSARNAYLLNLAAQEVES
jgi:capsid protein